MATASFPTVNCCLTPVNGRISFYTSWSIHPMSYSSIPNSLNSPQSFEIRDKFKQFANQGSLRGSKYQYFRSNTFVITSIGRITVREFTCQHCSCSVNQGAGIPLIEKHAYSIRFSKNKKTINLKTNHGNFSCVGYQTVSPRMTSLVGFNLFVTFGAGYGIEELDSKEASIGHEEDKPSSRANRVVTLRYLEERDEEVLSKQILELSRSNKLTSALELFRSMEAFRLKPNLHACNSLLACFLRNNMLDDALGVFEYMRNKRVISGHSFSMMFKAIAKARGSDKALKMFMEILRDNEHEKDFDVVVYNTVISICAKVNDWFQMESLWGIMKENGHIGTAVTYNVLICTFVRCGQYELSIAAYSEMLQNRVEPSVDSMHAIIGACTKEGKWDLAMSVYENMLASDLKPNLIAFNSLINLLGRCGKVETAFRVYNQMKLYGHIPDSHTWNALLGALYMTDQYASALELFHRMRTETSFRLNTELYNTALMCCQRLRLWDKSLQLLWMMEDSGLAVTTASYNLVIGTCEVARKPKIALQVFEHMVHQKCPADTFTYLSLARSCIWGSLWYEVEAILKLTSDVSLYNTIIQGMCLRGKFDAAKRLYTEMRKIGLVPDGKTRAMMLQHLTKKSP